jgi:hypothetical protein
MPARRLVIHRASHELKSASSNVGAIAPRLVIMVHEDYRAVEAQLSPPLPRVA